MIEIDLILLHGSIELPLAQDNEEVQAFTPYTAQESLANSVGLGSLIGRGQDFNARPFGGPVEGEAVLVVVVSNQKPRSLAKGGRLPQLLGHPGVAWTSGHTKMHQPARTQSL